MAKLELVNVFKQYDGGVDAVKELNLSCEDGEFLALLGPSGCGKSTTLRMIAGLEEITGGELRIGGQDMTEKTSRERNIALAFETYALYPPMTVYENIAFPLRCAKVSELEIKKRVKEVVDLVEIGDILEKKPGSLSGGQKQAVGLARALVRKPSVFLLDEPISHFDARQRGRMRVRIKRMQMQLGITMVYVTHDQLEAMAMADQIVVMNFGVLQQVGTPDEIYNKPANTFVAGFIGDPPMNMIECQVSLENGQLYLREKGFSILLPSKLQTLLNNQKINRDARVIFGIRPNYVSIGKDKKDNGIPGKVVINEFLGEERVYTMQIGENTRIQSLVDGGFQISEGDTVSVELQPDMMFLFDTQTGAVLK